MATSNIWATKESLDSKVRDAAALLEGAPWVYRTLYELCILNLSNVCYYLVIIIDEARIIVFTNNC